jgi:hypothetical protein
MLEFRGEIRTLLHVVRKQFFLEFVLRKLSRKIYPAIAFNPVGKGNKSKLLMRTHRARESNQN